MNKKQQILERVRETQPLRDNVITIADIAKEFGVSREYIYQVIRESEGK